MKTWTEDEVKLSMHLDDDAFSELAMGKVPDVRVQTHLESCAKCREELERFQGSVGSFSLASLAWSEEKSAGLPALRPTGRSKASPDASRPYPGMVWVAALLLLIGVAVPVTKMHFTTLHDGDSASLVDDDAAGLNSQEQIAKDNQLMEDVNYELTHSRAVLRSQDDLQRGVPAGVGMTETGKRSR